MDNDDHTYLYIYGKQYNVLTEYFLLFNILGKENEHQKFQEVSRIQFSYYFRYSQVLLKQDLYEL